MALGKQQASSHTLDRFLAWAKAYGFRIAEHPDYGGVHPGVHKKGSWHDDGLAADLNWGAPGTSSAEKERFKHAITVAKSMGLSTIHALYGTNGSASTHKTHLHVDCGQWTNLGDRYTRTPAGDRKVQLLQNAVHFPLKERDNLWGSNTDKRLESVRAASKFKGGKFPSGVKFTQKCVGTPQDGTWDDADRAAHDQTVMKIQGILGVKADGIWGAKTDRAYLALRKEKKL
jgi:hypothetical protein